MKKGLIRPAALAMAVLLTALTWTGCSFAGITVRQMESEKPIGNEPLETEPPEADAADPADPLESFAVRYPEEAFWEERGDVRVLAALSFEPKSARFLPDGRLFAVGSGDAGRTAHAAVVDLDALSIAERDIDISGEPGWQERAVEAVCAGDRPMIWLEDARRLISLGPDLTEADRRQIDGGDVGTAVGLRDGGVMFSRAAGGIFVCAETDGDGRIVLHEERISLPAGYNAATLRGETEDGLLLVSLDNAADWEDMEDEYRYAQGVWDRGTGELTVFPDGDSVFLCTAGAYIA